MVKVYIQGQDVNKSVSVVEGDVITVLKNGVEVGKITVPTAPTGAYVTGTTDMSLCLRAYILTSKLTTASQLRAIFENYKILSIQPEQ